MSFLPAASQSPGLTTQTQPLAISKPQWIPAKNLLGLLKILEENSIPVTETGCHLWLGATRASGYAYLYDPLRYRLLHVLISQVRGDTPSEHVRHLCGVRICVNPNHIKPGTAVENMADQYRHESRLGVRNSAAKLTSQQVVEIRARKAGSRRHARQLGISWTHYIRIRNYTRWEWM